MPTPLAVTVDCAAIRRVDALAPGGRS